MHWVLGLRVPLDRKRSDPARYRRSTVKNLKRPEVAAHLAGFSQSLIIKDQCLCMCTDNQQDSCYRSAECTGPRPCNRVLPAGQRVARQNGSAVASMDVRRVSTPGDETQVHVFHLRGQAVHLLLHQSSSRQERCSTAPQSCPELRPEHQSATYLPD